MRKKRELWRQFQQDNSCQNMVFLNGTGAKTDMTRRYGRALKGVRCHDHAPDGRWERTTILSALKYDGTTCDIVIKGALDNAMYNGYVKKFLAPFLKPEDIVIMDNLNVHKSAIAQKIISECGAKCIFIPQYSPDLNPIEKMWSKVTQVLRGIKARTSDELMAAVKTALESITPLDAMGWFKSWGYKFI